MTCKTPDCNSPALYGVTTYAYHDSAACEPHLREAHASGELVAAYPLDDTPLPPDLKWF